jgi:hypothetical protein
VPLSSNAVDIVSKVLNHLEQTGHLNISIRGSGQVNINPLSIQCDDCEYTERNDLQQDWEMRIANLPGPHHGLWRYVFDTQEEVAGFNANLAFALQKYAVNSIRSQSSYNPLCVDCKWRNPDQTEGEITSAGGWRKTCLEGRSGPHQRIILGQPQNFTTCKYYEFNGYRPSRLERILEEGDL